MVYPLICPRSSSRFKRSDVLGAANPTLPARAFSDMRELAARLRRICLSTLSIHLSLNDYANESSFLNIRGVFTLLAFNLTLYRATRNRIIGAWRGRGQHVTQSTDR